MGDEVIRLDSNMISCIAKVLEKSGYSSQAIEYYLNKKNVGTLKDPSVSAMYTGECGDTMEIFLQISSDIILDAKFQAVGGAGIFSSGSALMEIVKGKTLEEAERISEKTIITFLGQIPKQKIHCAHLAKRALLRTIEKYHMREREAFYLGTV